MGSNTDGPGATGIGRVALGLTFVAGAIAVLSLTAWVAGGLRLRPEAGLEATMPPDAAVLVLLLSVQFHLTSSGRRERLVFWLKLGAVLLCAAAALTSLVGHAMAAQGFTWSLQPGVPRMPPLAGGLLFLVSEGVLFSLLPGGGTWLPRTAGIVLAATAWLAAVATGLVECLRHPVDLPAGAAAQALLCAVCVFLISTSLLTKANQELGLLGLAPENAAVALLGGGLGPAFMLVASVQAALGAAARLPSPDLGNAIACGFALASYLAAAVAVLWLMLRQTTDHLSAPHSPQPTAGISPQTPLFEPEPVSQQNLCQARSHDELYLAACEMLTEKLQMSLAWVATLHSQPPTVQVVCYGGNPAGMFTAGSDPVHWEIQDPGPFMEIMQNSRGMAWDALTPPPVELPWPQPPAASSYPRGALLPIKWNGQVWGLLGAFDRETSPMSHSLRSALQRAADTVACVMDKLADQSTSRQLQSELGSCDLRLQKLAAVAPGIVYQLRVGSDGAPRYTYISPKAAVFGLSTDPNHPDWRLGEIIHPDDRNRFFETVARCIMERRDFHFQGRALIGGRLVCFTASSVITVGADELVFDGFLTET